MDQVTILKLLLALAAALLFAASMWTGIDWLRWVAIAMLAVAVLLRFAARKRKDDE
jgi:ABC-type bacteriocin/lantibiotic exporter with double-glycine peptidase domain